MVLPGRPRGALSSTHAIGGASGSSAGAASWPAGRCRSPSMCRWPIPFPSHGGWPRSGARTVSPTSSRFRAPPSVICETARSAGLEIRGVRFMVSGEPITAARLRLDPRGRRRAVHALRDDRIERDRVRVPRARSSGRCPPPPRLARGHPGAGSARARPSRRGPLDLVHRFLHPRGPAQPVTGRRRCHGATKLWVPARSGRLAYPSPHDPELREAHGRGHDLPRNGRDPRSRGGAAGTVRRRPRRLPAGRGGRRQRVGPPPAPRSSRRGTPGRPDGRAGVHRGPEQRRRARASDGPRLARRQRSSASSAELPGRPRPAKSSTSTSAGIEPAGGSRHGRWARARAARHTVKVISSAGRRRRRSGPHAQP